MTYRPVYLLLVASLLVAPMFIGTVVAKQGPDGTVASLVVSRLTVPPTRWSFTTTVCNIGKDPAAAGGQVTWTATPMPGPLSAAGDGETRVIATWLLPALAVNECVVLRNFWNSGAEDGLGAFNFGEWEFSAGVTLDGDQRPNNNIATARAAFPVQLLGTGVGGFDPPTLP